MATFDILLVEDNPDDIALTREALVELEESAESVNLVIAEDGARALEIVYADPADADAFRPDIILLDLKLPKLGGHQVLERLKEDLDLRRIPVIVLTTSDAENDVMEAYDALANSYVVKPVDLDDFIATVKGILDFWMRIARIPRS